MTNRFYMISSIILFSLIAFIFLSHEYMVESEWVLQNTFLPAILFFAPTVLSLCCLYLSIYAYKSKVEPVKRFGRPITIFGIIFALICLVGSLIPPISGYFSFRNLANEYMIFDSLENSQPERIDPQRNLLSKHEARLYYRQTTELTEYVDENGNKLLYVPDKSDQLYIQNRQYRESLRRKVISIKRSVIVLVVMTTLSFFSFVLFLRYMKKVGKIGEKVVSPQRY